MILDELKNIKSSKQEIIKFSRIVGFAFIILGAILSILNCRIHPIPFIIGIALIVIGGIIPKALLPVHKLWMGFSVILGYISTRLILTAFYFLILAPIAVVGRLCGKDFLDEKLDRSKPSYWINKKDHESINENIKKQY